MKITMYELLGMVKDDKTPKKIKYDGRIFEFDELEEQYCYHNENYTINDDLNCYIEGLKRTILNDTVEILEEEKKIPEKLNYQYRNLYGRLSQHKQSEIDIIDKLNEVLDYLKSKGDE